MEKHLELLGKKCEEVVTGVTGVVTMITFDLYGCIQAVLELKHKKGEKPLDEKWYDVGRLTPGQEVIEAIFPDDLADNLLDLGYVAVDNATGFKGVVTSILISTGGSMQYLLTPKAGKDGAGEQKWLLSNRVKIKSSTPVMMQPDFMPSAVAEGRKGPADKPSVSRIPTG